MIRYTLIVETYCGYSFLIKIVDFTVYRADGPASIMSVLTGLSGTVRLGAANMHSVVP